MARFYRAPNKRLIARGGNGRFRQTTLADVGISTCEKCGQLFVPDYSTLGPMADPRKFRELQRLCSTCLGGRA